MGHHYPFNIVFSPEKSRIYEFSSKNNFKIKCLRGNFLVGLFACHSEQRSNVNVQHSEITLIVNCLIKMAR